MEERAEEGVVTVEHAESATPRVPAMGKYEGLAPMHTLPFAIEQNVHRIATQIAEGRQATYD
jgi:hypothetical protein